MRPTFSKGSDLSDVIFDPCGKWWSSTTWVVPWQWALLPCLKNSTAFRRNPYSTCAVNRKLNHMINTRDVYSTHAFWNRTRPLCHHCIWVVFAGQIWQTMDGGTETNCSARLWHRERYIISLFRYIKKKRRVIMIGIVVFVFCINQPHFIIIIYIFNLYIPSSSVVPSELLKSSS
jgi:hypothetical protein